MAKQITITNIVGSEPYDVYLCDNLYGGCIYIATINNSDLPYNFLVPNAFEALSTVGVKVIDDNNCEIKNTVSI
jgi:hypothetical protein